MKILIILSLMLSMNNWAKADSGGAGNGGDSTSQEFVAYGHYLRQVLKTTEDEDLKSISLAKLKEVIKKTKVEAVDALPMNKDAMNFPEETPQRIAVLKSSWKKISEKQKLALALHEYLGLLGIEINTYGISAKLLNVTETEFDGPLDPIVLKEFDNEDGKKMRYYDAKRLCSNYKKLYEASYFYVFCEFKEEKKEEMIKATFMSKDYIYLGVRSYESWERDYLGYYRYEKGHTPIYVEVEIPRTEEFVNTVQVYGLTIKGIGKISELDWKVVLDSDNLFNGMGTSFKNRIAALTSCVRIKSEYFNQNERNPLMERSICSTVEKENNKYGFQILTKNPFAQI